MGTPLSARLRSRALAKLPRWETATSPLEAPDTSELPQLPSNSQMPPPPDTHAHTSNARPPSPVFPSRPTRPLLHPLPWLDTSRAAVIGPRSYGLCWWSQRVREAGARVVPVHHPAKESLPRRSFVAQRAHIVAARVRPRAGGQARQAVPSEVSREKRPRAPMCRLRA